MDYNYFNATPQPYQFMGHLPPTPTHTNPSNSEDYVNGGTPDQYDQAFQSYETFGAGFDATTLLPGSPNSQQKPALLNGEAMNLADLDNEQLRGRSSSEEKESLTPAQSRRKAQNRAAQRAFRERKEKHVKDLEQKLQSLESNSNDIAAENERLKREIHRLSTENRILKATSNINHVSPTHSPVVPGPMTFSPKEQGSLSGPSTPAHRLAVSEQGERLLAAGATWDFIQQHPLTKRGLVDVAAVHERLKNATQCDGQGPVYEERKVLAAIEASAASGSDELI